MNNLDYSSNCIIGWSRFPLPNRPSANEFLRWDCAGSEPQDSDQNAAGLVQDEALPVLPASTPWLAQGTCDKGDKCQFAHGDCELREKPNLLKTRLCETHLRGTVRWSRQMQPRRQVQIRPRRKGPSTHPWYVQNCPLPQFLEGIVQVGR